MANIVDYYLLKSWRMISDYGNRRDPITGATRMHHGIDFGIPLADRSAGNHNIPVPTPFSGIVHSVGNRGDRGLTVAQRIDGTKQLAIFQHLHRINVKAGQVLKPNDSVGLCGTTGRSTGVHLHFEIRNNDGSVLGGSVWGDPKLFTIPQSTQKGGMNVKTIILSAGHGGSDPGAVYHGVREKDVNLGVTLACERYLNDNYEGHRLVLPRRTDVTVSLPDRRELTRRENADLYVSIHHNAFRDFSANGFSTYVHSGPLFGTTIEYRNIIHDTVYDYVRSLGIRDRGKKRGDHWVTREMPAPTVLMEYMFLSNVNESKIASNPNVQQALGKYTAIGIAKALDLKRKIAGVPEQPKPPQPPSTMPAVQRAIGIEVDGVMTNIQGYLIDNSTYGHLAPIIRALGFEISGHGDHVKIKTK